MTLMLPVALERMDIVAFNLQYHDRFIWDGDLSEFNSAIVFREESHLLAPNIFDVDDLWHSHHGYFEYPDEPYKHQLLNSMEVQLIPSERAGLDPNQGLISDIKVSHRIFHGVEHAGGTGTLINTEDQTFGTGDEAGLLDTYMNEMHDKNKLLLSRLINDEMCGMINLDTPT